MRSAQCRCIHLCRVLPSAACQDRACASHKNCLQPFITEECHLPTLPPPFPPSPGRTPHGSHYTVAQPGRVPALPDNFAGIGTGMNARARSGNATVGIVLLLAAVAGASFPFFLTRTAPKVPPKLHNRSCCLDVVE